ncbi:NAD-binding protein [Rickenella mellea]|uniref:NAD-binding protein n=1 Tax=Rickenella mellea TaxID=50990 RepID=A0A4Y7Q362_9AGAM|nr:NAD-binding protein [Rickenella mellea]
MLVLSAADIANVVATFSPDLLTGMMAFVFVGMTGKDGVQCPQRTTVTSSNYDALIMPSSIDTLGTAVKIVCVPKERTIHGLPASTLLLDKKTGALRALINASSLTALRTGAGSALATNLVGPTVPHVLLCFGAGKQTDAHIDILLRAFPSFNHCIIVNRTKNDRLAMLHSSLERRFPDVQFTLGCAVEGIGLDAFDLQHAVEAADVICTATSSKKPLFQSQWVKVGTHINLVGSYTPHMAEVDDALIRRAGRVLVDSKYACLHEAGELLSAGISMDEMVEVGEITHVDGTGLHDEVIRLKSAGDITIFKSVGIATQDNVIAHAVVDKATSMGIGTHIPAYD